MDAHGIPKIFFPLCPFTPYNHQVDVQASFKQSINTDSQSSISCKDCPPILAMQSPTNEATQMFDSCQIHLFCSNDLAARL